MFFNTAADKLPEIKPINVTDWEKKILIQKNCMLKRPLGIPKEKRCYFGKIGVYGLLSRSTAKIILQSFRATPPTAVK